VLHGEFRDDETTLIEVLRPRRLPHRPRVPPKPYATTELALPSIIVEPDPRGVRAARSAKRRTSTLTATALIPRRRTERLKLRDVDPSAVLGPRTSGVLLGALAVIFGVAMLKVIPLLGPLFDAMMR
jgi:hypothetical protein